MNILKLIPLLLMATLPSCNLDKQPTMKMADLNLFVDTNQDFDSVFVSNIGQDREFHFIKYRDTLQIDFNDSINDLYRIDFFQNGKPKFQNQLWLNGSNITINFEITDTLEIDTVIGSDLYYTSFNFYQQYQELLKTRQNDSVTYRFLFAKLTENINNPFALNIANEIFFKNSADKKQLTKLYNLMATQSDVYRNHFISPFDDIESILNVNNIDVSEFAFYDRNENLTTLNLSNNKKYLFDFWFVACAPCVKDHKELSTKLDFLKQKNVELVGVSIDKDHGEWLAYLKQHDYNWLNVRELQDIEKRMTSKMVISVFPTYAITDSEGTILHRTFSLEETLSKLD
jgi:hypothetical protein